MQRHASHVEDVLSDARQAYESHDWQRAAELFEQAEQHGELGPADLHRLAWTRWIGGTVDTFGTLLERSYEGFTAAGDPGGAAVVALDLYRFYSTSFRTAVAGGWLRRAQTLLGSAAESSAHGFLELQQAFQAQRDGDLERGLAHAERALDIGARLDDKNLQALAMSRQGRLLIKMGRVTEGKSFLDEAMVAAVGGELSMSATGIICCSTIDGCADVADYGRAADWTRAAQRWCERKSISGFPGICRVHHAEIIRLRGAWEEAEAAARKAARELEHSAVLHVAAEAYYEIGEILLRKGDLDGADEAFRTANAMGRTPEPGKSLVRLARGKTRSAVNSLRRALDGQEAPLERARLLPAAAEVWLVAGEIDQASRAAEELATIATRYESVVFEAMARAARGQISLARGDAEGALRELEASLRAWQTLEFPYEAARTRLALARAYLEDGDEDTAVEEAEAARATFESLGAHRDLEAARELLQGAEPAPATALPVVRTFVFTDIVDSTLLVESLGDKAWSRVMRWHDETLRSVFQRHGGREIKHTGDGFHLAFEAPAAAIDAAVEIQRALAAQRLSGAFSPEVRIGIHCAEAFEHAGDFVGVGVHQAARIAALARGGQILVSATTAEQAGGRYETSSPQAASLKGIREAVDVLGVRWAHAGGTVGGSEPTDDDG